MAEYIEQCKKCFHFQVCAQVMKNQLKIRNIMLKEENPECEHFVNVANVVEVVRCKDCKLGNLIEDDEGGHVECLDYDFEPNDFCAYGERKSEQALKEQEDKRT